jgi:hypothetical protein
VRKVACSGSSIIFVVGGGKDEIGVEQRKNVQPVVNISQSGTLAPEYADDLREILEGLCIDIHRGE